MASYNVATLIRRFDTGADTAITGILSSFLGEVILLEAVCHWLAAEGHVVTMLPGRPARDDTAFGTNHPRPPDGTSMPGSGLMKAVSSPWNASTGQQLPSTVPRCPTSRSIWRPTHASGGPR